MKLLQFLFNSTATYLYFTDKISTGEVVEYQKFCHRSRCYQNFSRFQSEFRKQLASLYTTRWAVWNLFEEILRWFYRFEFSALINLVLSRPVSSQGYTQLFTLCPVCSERGQARSLRKLKASMSILLSIFAKQHKQKKEFHCTKVWRW